MTGKWRAKIEGPQGLILRYDIHLLQEVGDTGIEMRSTTEFGGPYAITRKGAERKARRLLAKERRKQAIEASAWEIS